MGTKSNRNKIFWTLLLLALVILTSCAESPELDPALKSPGILRATGGQNSVALMDAPAVDATVIDIAADGEEVIVVWEKSTEVWLYIATPRFTMGYVPVENCQIQGPRQFEELGAQ